MSFFALVKDISNKMQEERSFHMTYIVVESSQTEIRMQCHDSDPDGGAVGVSVLFNS